jgi:hypothetical protein
MNPFPSRRRLFIRLLRLTLAVMAGLLLAYLAFLELFDPGLTREARGAKPIIAALSTYHQAQGRFPSEAMELAAHLPPDIEVIHKTAFIPETIGGWEYNLAPDARSYHLGKRLTHDAWLFYDSEGVTGTWTFEDGGEETEVKLSP